jgi:hypothetical protein
MIFARSKTVMQQLNQVLASLVEINRLLVQFLANETSHSETHARIESRLEHVEQEITSLKQVKS